MMNSYLSQMFKSKIPNWRISVMNGDINARDENGIRILPRHLSTRMDCSNFDYGEFSETSRSKIRDYLLGKYQKRSEDFIDKAVFPTVIRLLVIGLFDLKMDEANFYLEHGGKRNKKNALKEFELQMGKFVSDNTIIIFTLTNTYNTKSYVGITNLHRTFDYI